MSIRQGISQTFLMRPKYFLNSPIASLILLVFNDFACFGYAFATIASYIPALAYPQNKYRLLQLYGASHLFYLLLNISGLFLGNSLLYRFGNTLHQIFCFFKPKSRNSANNFDHLYLLFAETRQYGIKLCFFFNC